MEEGRIDLPKLEGHNCFACGTENRKGLNLFFYRQGESICTDITLGKDHEGWENLAHGGILSTLLDETMSWTIIFFKRVFFVTRKMEIKYIRPVLVDEPITVKGMIQDDTREPRIMVRAEICDREGHVMTTAAGEFVVLPEKRLHMVPETLKNEMKQLFARLPEA